MSRQYNAIGLKREAVEWIVANCMQEPDLVCPKCNHIMSTKLKVINVKHEDCFFGDGPDLKTYQLKDGGTAEEIIQCEPWSSGPVVFHCLKINAKENEKIMFKWSDEEINKICE